jgi:AAA+ ATPase superfamily predicted ATPase
VGSWRKKMGFTKKQREAVIGMLLGDAWIQKTGKRNARLRLEHSIKQKEYIFWKYELLKNYMQSAPKLTKRYNPIWKKTYHYYRCQSLSSPEFGKLHRIFYKESRKIIPEKIKKFLSSPLTLAIWYMDDGYYYSRDKVCYIYLNKCEKDELQIIEEAFEESCKLALKFLNKKGLPVIHFDSKEAKKLAQIVKPYIIPSMQYKLPPTP